MQRINFLDKPETYNPPEAFVAHLSEIKSKEELIEKLCLALHFPDYFGFNWDALSDCLTDLSWLIQKEVVLVHDDFPCLEEGSFNTYIQILIDAIVSWENDSKHSLQVVFPRSFENDIRMRINSRET
jgi:RNAse (barnase) inhibitor barstar